VNLANDLLEALKVVLVTGVTVQGLFTLASSIYAAIGRAS
jgi:hypothetical protein